MTYAPTKKVVYAVGGTAALTQKCYAGRIVIPTSELACTLFLPRCTKQYQVHRVTVSRNVISLELYGRNDMVLLR